LKGVKVRHEVRHRRRFSLVDFVGRTRAFGLALLAEKPFPPFVPTPSNRRAAGICGGLAGNVAGEADT